MRPKTSKLFAWKQITGSLKFQNVVSGSIYRSATIMAELQPNKIPSNVVPLPDRTERLLRRVDEHLATLRHVHERRAFLVKLIADWNVRYARFICTEGRSDPSYSADDPPHCSDFLMTIASLSARLRGDR